MSLLRSFKVLFNWFYEHVAPDGAMMLAAGEGVEPSSSSSKPDVLPVTLSRNELVDLTGLKPAPHGLKGRCSVPRAPGQ